MISVTASAVSICRAGDAGGEGTVASAGVAGERDGDPGVQGRTVCADWGGGCVVTLKYMMTILKSFSNFIDIRG